MDNNKREGESIKIKHSHNGGLMTTKQILEVTQAHKYIVRAVNQNSKKIKNQQIVAKGALQ